MTTTIAAEADHYHKKEKKYKSWYRLKTPEKCVIDRPAAVNILKQERTDEM